MHLPSLRYLAEDKLLLAKELLHVTTGVHGTDAVMLLARMLLASRGKGGSSTQPLTPQPAEARAGGSGMPTTPSPRQPQRQAAESPTQHRNTSAARYQLKARRGHFTSLHFAFESHICECRETSDPATGAERAAQDESLDRVPDGLVRGAAGQSCLPACLSPYLLVACCAVYSMRVCGDVARLTVSQFALQVQKDNEGMCGGSEVAGARSHHWLVAGRGAAVAGWLQQLTIKTALA